MSLAARLLSVPVVVALLAAPAPAAAKQPTRLWYRLEATYRFTETSQTDLAKHETRIELRMTTDESVLLRSTDRGLGFLSDGNGQGFYTRLRFEKDNRKTPPGDPECRSTLTEFTRAAGTGVARLNGNQLEVYWSSARGDYTRAGTTRSVQVDRATGEKYCASIEHGDTREVRAGTARLYVRPVTLRWEHSFGRRVMVGRAEGTTGSGGRYSVVVRVERCPGTRSCDGAPSPVPEDLREGE